MGNRFAVLNQTPASETVIPELVTSRTTERPISRTTSRPQGKRSHPDFEKVGLYLHAEKRKRAERKWEDEGDGDFSDLIDKLLTKYLGD